MTRMGPFLENLYDVIFQPVTAMRQIAAARLAGQGLAAFFVSVLIPAGAAYFVLQAAQLSNVFPLMLMMHTVGRLVVWFVGAAVLGLIAEFYGGKGTAVGLFAAIGFAHLPWIFAVPLWVLAVLLPAGLSAITFAASFVLVIAWMLVLIILAIKGAYGLSTAKAVLVLATPLLVLVVAFAMLVIFIGAAFWPGWLGL
jgi:hypothetical protein